MANTAASHATPATLSRDDAGQVYSEAVGLLTRLLVPRNPTPDELQDKLPEIAMALYDGVQEGWLSEDEYWQIIRTYAAGLGEMRVRTMLANTIRWSPVEDRAGRFSLFGTVGVKVK